jgi:hypothetical protein
MRKLLLIATLLIASSASAQTKPPLQPVPEPVIGSAKAPLPQREADYIVIIQNARRQYAAAKSIDARKNIRMAMQSAIHLYMGLSHSAQDWVGIFKDSKKNPKGSQSLQIEIAPGVTIGTWDNPTADVTSDTMLQQFSALGKLVNGLSIGEEVMFSADLLGSVVGNDDDMVLRPRVIARFSQLKMLDETKPVH